MGRASRTKRLNVWMNGNLVGFWSIRSSGVHEFQYARSWLAFSDARPISLSLPLALDDSVYTGPKVEAFFNNLLPDNIEIRRRIQRKFSAAAKVLPKDFPASISDPIFEGALEAASRLDRSTSSNTF